MAKDAKGHGSEKRGSDYAPSASGKPGYNPVMQGGKRMFGRQPTPAEAAANSQAVKNFAALASAHNDPNHPLGVLHRVVSEGTPIAGIPAHSSGVEKIGQPAPAPNFRLNSYTHEIVSPTGEVTARMRLGKNNGLAVDYPAGPRGSSGQSSISRSGGPSIHDAVSMPDYRAKGGSFPAEHIAGALHFLTGNDFAGHTVRRIKG